MYTERVKVCLSFVCLYFLYFGWVTSVHLCRWFMPVNILITFIIGSALGWAVNQITRAPTHLRGLVIGCCAAGKYKAMGWSGFSCNLFAHWVSETRHIIFLSLLGHPHKRWVRGWRINMTLNLFHWTRSSLLVFLARTERGIAFVWELWTLHTNK